ncbi:interleukin-6 receptor subunit beta-like isoform X2 [Myripristis murdjan]|uniref:interleukin-6 receptor subunit beta-like isoform X2 n=1 Tax=Myripristis murdjan TaxID=586833 RepID=UPI0011760D6B|nr:interleukin-6 receptor subunit beta-like isoform X2 [Myripristis murdjan]
MTAYHRGLLHVLAWVCLASSLPASAEHEYHVMVVPQSPVVEIGSNFTATCMLINTSEATADDLYWISSRSVIPKEQYTKISGSAVNVTITITRDTPQWLLCKCRKPSSPYITIHEGKFVHGILLRKGYHPEKPENLSCVAIQEKDLISPNITCVWEPGIYRSQDLKTKYTLCVTLPGETQKVEAKQNNSAQITFQIFPNHVELDFWVEAENMLGKAESEHLIAEADWFVKTNPPSDVKAISEKQFPTSLLIKWIRPIAKEYVTLMYQIRYRSNRSPSWRNVPPVDIAKEIESFRLQELQPDTVYVIQVRCKSAREGYGYWSSWSANATARTPEDIPKSEPDLWRISRNEREVLLVCKDPVLSNGKIRSFNTSVRRGKASSSTTSVNRSDSDGSSSKIVITILGLIDLPKRETVYVEVVAINSVGKSPKARLEIPAHERSPAEGLKSWSQSGQLWLEWQPPKVTAGGDAVTEYVVEWDDGLQIDWQRERGNTTRTAIRGSLEKFKRYTISVYSLYSGSIGTPVSVEDFLEQGVPSEGPSVKLNGTPGTHEAQLVWKEIPQDKQHGFITNYTIFYSAGTEEHAIPVPNDTYSYPLRSLSSDTKYEAWISASTIRGSVNGTKHSFSTLKYAPGEIEGIVVGVCLGFLFIVLLAVLICIYKRDIIKKNFWPQIPNPGNSSIGTWSPDFPSKADTPKENAPADVSVVEVDLLDRKSVFEEDKACLPLKKDKYLSEEHSSGIGGSSCMSSPRQSVSDSDEGGDSSETTASTVQYSSVVACSGYKGQTPSSLPKTQQPTFFRSESTQPLLDFEENPDIPRQENSRQFGRLPRNPSFRHSPTSEDSSNSADVNQLEMEDRGGMESLSFCPVEEGPQQTIPTEESQSSDWQQGVPVCSYMPQLGGYRPQ